MEQTTEGESAVVQATATGSFKKKKTSGVHDFFTLNEEGRTYKCKICSLDYSKVGTCTSNLRNHLQRAHKTEFDSLPVSSSTSRKRARSESAQISREGFLEKLTKFVVTTNQPFSIVDDPSFRDLLDYVSKDPAVSCLPGRTYITKQVSETYQKQKLEVKRRIAEANSKVSFVLDLWTSSNKLPLQGIICRFIDKDWNLVTLALDLVEISGVHSGENIAHSFKSVLREFGLEDRIMAVTTDNASNMNTFFNYLAEDLRQRGILFEIEDQRVRCLAHILNLCAQQLIKIAKESVSLVKLHSLITEIGRTPQRKELYYRQCLDRKMLPGLDVDHRWNSTYDMLTQSIEMKSSLDAVCSEGLDRSLVKFAISEEEWKHLEKLQELLKPIKTATLQISVQHHPSIAKTTTTYQSIFTHFDKHLALPDSAKVEFPWIEPAIEASKSKLLDYYWTSGGKAHCIGFMLHPSYKDAWFKQVSWSKSWVREYKAKIKSEWEKKYKSSETSALIPRQSTSHSAELYEEQMGQVLNKDELESYFDEPIVPYNTLKEIGVLQWWKSREQEYPYLSNMARDYLGVAGSGVPVEAFFSSGTDILTENRQRLNAQHVKELMCCKQWFQSL